MIRRERQRRSRTRDQPTRTRCRSCRLRSCCRSASRPLKHAAISSVPSTCRKSGMRHPRESRVSFHTSATRKCSTSRHRSCRARQLQSLKPFSASDPCFLGESCSFTNSCRWALRTRFVYKARALALCTKLACVQSSLCTKVLSPRLGVEAGRQQF